MILIDGEFACCVNAQDRGLLYGDGVFRTTRLKQGRVLHWERQYARLARDCTALGIVCPERRLFEQDIDTVSAQYDKGVIKLTVTRGVGARGYAPQRDAVPARLTQYAAMPGYPEHAVREGVAVRLCDLRLARQPRLAGIKHLNRLEQVLARAEWQDTSLFEGVLCDEQGCVIGGTMTNLFVRHGKQLVTPCLSHSGVAGLTRDLVMECAPELGFSVREGVMTVPMLHAADEVLLCNSLLGVWPVRRLDERVWQVSRLAADLCEKLEC